MRPIHRLGQNFLVDRDVLAEIIERSGVCGDDTVLEIGAGRGVLTRELVKKAAFLHAVEIDERLRPELERLGKNADNMALHWGDALRLDYSLLSPFPNKVVANIPYNITTPLIWGLLRYARLGLKYHLYMVQREAAERLTAPPDTRARYPLGVTLEVMGLTKIVRRVPPECFRPIPKVESALVEIFVNVNAADDNSWPDLELWGELLHRGFQHRRKTLINNLRGFRGLNWDILLSRDEAGARAEDLTAEEWLGVYRRFAGELERARDTASGQA